MRANRICECRAQGEQPNTSPVLSMTYAPARPRPSAFDAEMIGMTDAYKGETYSRHLHFPKVRGIEDLWIEDPISRL